MCPNFLHKKLYERVAYDYITEQLCLARASFCLLSNGKVIGGTAEQSSASDIRPFQPLKLPKERHLIGA
jgi:hypothetical protein